MSNLRLQNLLYEKQHYEADIRACLRHESAFSDADIELLPLDEFLENVRTAGEGIIGFAMIDDNGRQNSDT